MTLQRFWRTTGRTGTFLHVSPATISISHRGGDAFLLPQLLVERVLHHGCACAMCTSNHGKASLVHLGKAAMLETDVVVLHETACGSRWLLAIIIHLPLYSCRKLLVAE